MYCSVCKKPMIVLELDEVEIDYCTYCRGIWLDAGELELLFEDSREKDKLLASFKTNKTTKEKRRRCPICLKKMEKVLIGTTEKVLIDKCRDYHGLWFDKGEVEEIIKMNQPIDKDNRILNLLENMFGKKIGRR